MNITEKVIEQLTVRVAELEKEIESAPGDNLLIHRTRLREQIAGIQYAVREIQAAQGTREHSGKVFRETVSVSKVYDLESVLEELRIPYFTQFLRGKTYRIEAEPDSELAELLIKQHGFGYTLD